MRPSRRVRISTATAGVAVVEWLLFELVRIPYSPPYDMLTALGREKYAVHAVMGVIAAGWSLYVTCDGLRTLPAPRDGLAFAALLCGLAGAFAAVALYPPWPVTPLDLLFK